METTKQFCRTCHTEHGADCGDRHTLKVYTKSGHDRINHRRSITDHHGEEFVFIKVLAGWPFVLEIMSQNGETHHMPKHRFPIIVTTKRLQ